MTTTESKKFTLEDISPHNDKTSLYMAIHGKVYDVTKFIDEHPGGEEVLFDVGGQDATEAFEDVGHTEEARKQLESLYIGDLDPSSIPIKVRNPRTKAPDSNNSTFALAFGAAAALIAFFLLQFLK